MFASVETQATSLKTIKYNLTDDTQRIAQPVFSKDILSLEFDRTNSFTKNSSVQFSTKNVLNILLKNPKVQYLIINDETTKMQKKIDVFSRKKLYLFNWFQCIVCSFKYALSRCIDRNYHWNLKSDVKISLTRIKQKIRTIFTCFGTVKQNDVFLKPLTIYISFQSK
jgi:hypothetical protein